MVVPLPYLVSTIVAELVIVFVIAHSKGHENFYCLRMFKDRMYDLLNCAVHDHLRSVEVRRECGM